MRATGIVVCVLLAGVTAMHLSDTQRQVRDSGAQSPAASSSAAPVAQKKTPAPQNSVPCTRGFTDWFNLDSPNVGDGDREQVSSALLASLCPGGTMTTIDCETVDDIPYYGSGENNTCELDGGLTCNHADNYPFPCSDYKIRYLCICGRNWIGRRSPVFYLAPAGSATSSAAPVTQTTTAPQNTQQCTGGMSPWMNKDSPDSGDGDREQMSASELASFCPGGTITAIDCKTVDDIPYYSSGEILTCTKEGGLMCNNADNYPIPCSDYKIRYECTCAPAGSATSSAAPVTQTTTAPQNTQQCTGGMSPWMNKDSPDSGDGDREQMSASELASFCPGGTITAIDCKTVDDIPYYSNGEILMCTKEGGLMCNNADNHPIPCSDYKIRYECTCAPAGSATSSAAPVTQTTTAPQNTQQCTGGMSPWMNKDSPDSGDGDREQMSASELASFCPGGTITAIDCKTVDDIPYYSSGEILTCTKEGGLMCNNADNYPIPCSDYKIRYECTCAPAGSATSSAAPVTQTTTAPQNTQQCTGGMSPWMNKDSPDSGDGDREQMSASELASFCPGGTITAIDCKTVDDIPYYSNGEILMCTKEGGLMCNNADNHPIPCSDYKIRYECTCAPAGSATSSAAPVTQTTTAPQNTQQCTGGMSPWMNKDSPDSGDGDREQMSASELASFCPGGTITAIDCKTVDDIPYYSSGEILTCTKEGGLMCNNADNYPILCSDYKIRYECTCAPAGSATSSAAPVTQTTTAPQNTQQCTGGMSPWMNKDSPDSGDGDREQMSASELASFCPGGTITAIDCKTVDDIPYYSNGEILMCTKEGGLMCNNADNHPIPCSDYKIRYECTCAPAGSATSSAAPVTQTTTAPQNTQQCTGGMSPWMIKDSPDSGDGDREQMSASELASFCPGGTITAIDCKTVDDIPYYSNGEILMCTKEGGLMCNNAYNHPIPCSDYKIRYECTCAPAGSDTSSAAPVAQTTTAPQNTQQCTGGMSPWMNKDSPDSGDGDHEQMSASELASFCPGGTITAIDCKTVDDIPYYSSGESVTCEFNSGLTCKNADNHPIPCSDYKIQYECTCPAVAVTTSAPAVTSVGTTGEGVLPPQYTPDCTGGMSPWVNKDSPDSGDGDREQMSASELASFCPGGTITRIDCKTVDDIPYYSSGESVTCDLARGLTCKNADNFPIPCSDYKIQYECTCPAMLETNSSSDCEDC